MRWLVRLFQGKLSPDDELGAFLFLLFFGTAAIIVAGLLIVRPWE